MSPFWKMDELDNVIVNEISQTQEVKYQLVFLKCRIYIFKT
jgi:hypothetical protein